MVKKIKGGSRFSKAAVKMVAFLTENFDFNVGNITVKQIVYIPEGIKPAPFFWQISYILISHLFFLSSSLKLDLSTLPKFY